MNARNKLNVAYFNGSLFSRPSSGNFPVLAVFFIVLVIGVVPGYSLR